MLWKVAGGLLLAWIALMVVGSVVGFVVKALIWGAVIVGAVFIGTAAYRAIKGDSPKQIGS